MARRHAIIGVEGPHDQAFVSAALKLLGLKVFGGELAKLDSFWEPFIPRYPSLGNLYRRLDMPSIVFNGDISVAIYAGEGTRMKTELHAILELTQSYRTGIQSFGIVADADNRSPGPVVQRYSNHFRDYYPGFPRKAGVIDPSDVRTGIFVFPDNDHEGVVDSLLVDCGRVVYPAHINHSIEFIDRFDEADRSHWKPFDREKAIVASAASILRPGMTNAVTIRRDRWLAEESMSVPGVARFLAFARELLEIS